MRFEIFETAKPDAKLKKIFKHKMFNLSVVLKFQAILLKS